MVNTGKPSTGCVNCRARHIKCDEGKPACMKCIRTNRVCQGYRNPAAVRFRNLTQQQVKSTGSVRRPWPKTSSPAAARKSSRDGSPLTPDKTPLSAGSPASSGSLASPAMVFSSPNFHLDDLALFDDAFSFDTDSSSDPLSLDNISTAPLRRASSASSGIDPSLFDFSDLKSHSLCQLATTNLPAQIPPSIESQAACFFAANFVVLPSAKSRFGYLDFLLPLLKTSPASSPLPDAFTAVSLYSFASRPSHREILPAANKAYVRALHSLNMAIRDAILSHEYATVASTLLLALIEVLVPSSTTPRITGWPSHISGAANLCKAKGDELFASDIGRSIFRVVRHQMTLDSVTNSKEIEFGTEWWMSRVPLDSMLQETAELNLHVSQLRADAGRLMLRDRHHVATIRQVSQLLKRAEEFEPQSAAWFKRLLREDYARVTASRTPPPESLNNNNSSSTRTAGLPPGRNLITFSGFSVAAAYMNACLTRFFILEVIIRCTAWLLPPGNDYRTAPEYLRCARVGAEVVRGVVAAVPYFFEAAALQGTSAAGLADDTNKLTFACGLDDPAEVKGLSGMCCLWPVFSAAGSDFATPEQRAYLVEKLKFAGEVLGIQSSRIFLMGLAQFRFPSFYVERDMSYLTPANSPPRALLGTENIYKMEVLQA